MRTRILSAAATERKRAVDKRADQLATARLYLSHCLAELASPSAALAYVSRGTWLHLAEHWRTWVAILSAPRVVNQ